MRHWLNEAIIWMDDYDGIARQSARPRQGVRPWRNTDIHKELNNASRTGLNDQTQEYGSVLCLALLITSVPSKSLQQSMADAYCSWVKVICIECTHSAGIHCSGGAAIWSSTVWVSSYRTCLLACVCVKSTNLIDLMCTISKFIEFQLLSPERYICWGVRRSVLDSNSWSVYLLCNFVLTAAHVLWPSRLVVMSALWAAINNKLPSN